jgi:hypothetical protein
MSDDDRRVMVQFGDVIYRGRHSVNQRGDVVHIDGKLVGVEVDCNGDPLTAPLPVATIERPTVWARIARWWSAVRT